MPGRRWSTITPRQHYSQWPHYPNVMTAGNTECELAPASWRRRDRRGGGAAHIVEEPRAEAHVGRGKRRLIPSFYGSLLPTPFWGSGLKLLKGNGVTLPPLPVRGAISSPFGVARAAKAL